MFCFQNTKIFYIFSTISLALFLVVLVVIGGILFVELAPDASAADSAWCQSDYCSDKTNGTQCGKTAQACSNDCCSIGFATCTYIAGEVWAPLWECWNGACTVGQTYQRDSCTSWEAEGKDPNDCAECAGPNPAPTCSISPSSSTISAGGSQTLTLSSTNATSCTTTLPSCSDTSCTTTVSPASTTTYIANCSGTGGSGNCNATVTVTPLGCTTNSNCALDQICTFDEVCVSCLGRPSVEGDCGSHSDCALVDGNTCDIDSTCYNCPLLPPPPPPVIPGDPPPPVIPGDVIKLPNPLTVGSFQELLNRILQILLVFATPVYVLMIAIAGWMYIVGGANPTKRNSAKMVLLYSTIGFLVIVGARLIALVVIGVLPLA